MIAEGDSVWSVAKGLPTHSGSMYLAASGSILRRALPEQSKRRLNAVYKLVLGVPVVGYDEGTSDGCQHGCGLAEGELLVCCRG